MYAVTERDKDEWIAQIGKAIVKNSGMFIPEQYTGGNDGSDADDYSDDDGGYNNWRRLFWIIVLQCYLYIPIKHHIHIIGFVNSLCTDCHKVTQTLSLRRFLVTDSCFCSTQVYFFLTPFIFLFISVSSKSE